MAHPVRPDSYIEINNFYTMTIYYKGAEVIRMLHTMLGEHKFRKGMDLYFQRHDGQRRISHTLMGDVPLAPDRVIWRQVSVR